MGNNSQKMSSSSDQRLLSHKVKRDELQAGDHIYSWRGLFIYSHHGIYVGDGKVIHFNGNVSAGIGSIFKKSSSRPCPNCGHKARATGVLSSCLDCFLKKGKLRRYRYGVSATELAIKIRGGCTAAPSDPAKVVVKRADLFLRNNSFGKYNLGQNNCEDFSLYCKTEKSGAFAETKGCSSQMKSLRAIFSSFYKLNVVGAYCKALYKNDIGVRGDVQRISVQEYMQRLGIGCSPTFPERWFGKVLRRSS